MFGRNKKKADDPEKGPGRLGQIRQAYTMARRVDTRLGWYLAGTFLLVLSIFVLLAVFVGPWYIWSLFGFTLALLATSILFGRRAESAVFKQMEGRPGAAASALTMLRKGWYTDQAIAVNRQQDLVHRAVGRPGIVLVGEGNPNRVKGLLNQERKRHQRVLVDTPVTIIVVGNGEDEVPLKDLVKTLRKLPKAVRPAEITEIMNRLRAMPSKPVPMPKGPLPKGAKLPRGAVPPPR